MNITLRTSGAMAVGVALYLGALLGVPNSFAEGKQDFTLHNETGKTIKEVYVGPSSSEEWGDDVMGKDVVADGTSVRITFHPKATANHWDLKIVFEDDKWTVWNNFDLSTIDDITISYKDGKPWATWK